MEKSSVVLAIVGIILLLISGTARADMIADSTHPVQFIFSGYNLNYTTNLSNSIETTTTTYLNLSINSSYIWFNMTVADDLTLSNLTYVSNIWNFTGTSTVGTMTITANVSNVSSSYDLKVDGTVSSTQTASGGHVAFTYNGWSTHSFTIQENTSSPVPPVVPGAPSITSYSPADLTPTISVNSLATFEAGANQTVQWTWTEVTEGAGDGTLNSTATKTWVTIGAKTVTVTCSNANGSCGIIQWDVTIVSVGSGSGYNLSGYVKYPNLTPAENARVRVWNQPEYTTGTDGYYIFTGLPADNYTALFEKDYYYDGVGKINLLDNTTYNYTFTSKAHISTPWPSGILAFSIVLIAYIITRHRKH